MLPTPQRLSRAILLSLLGVLPPLVPVNAKEPSSISLNDVALDFALNPETGNLAAISFQKDSATLYRAGYFEGDQTKLVGPVALGEMPSAIVFKRYRTKTFYAVVCVNDSHMYLLDGDAFTIVKKVPLQARSNPTRVAASINPDDPYVYYCNDREQRGSFGRVNLENLSHDGEILANVRECSVSASGRLFYFLGPGMPGGLDCRRKIEAEQPGAKPQFERVFHDHKDVPGYVPDSLEEYTAAGRTIYTANLQKKAADLSFTPLCFFPDRPVVAGVSNYAWELREPQRHKPLLLVTASCNTFHESSRTLLPAKLLDTPVSFVGKDHRDYSYLLPHGLRMFADAKRKQIVAAYSNQVVRVPLADLDLSDEPLLHVRPQGSEPLPVGKEATIKLLKADPRTKVAVEQGPKGLTITDDGFRWTPGLEDPESVDLQLRLSHGNTQRVQTITLRVKHSSIQLPIEAESLRLSPDGKLALCFSSRWRSDVALVDLEHARVLVTGTIAYKISDACVDEHFIYVTAAERGLVEGLSHKDLSSQRKAFFKEPKTVLEPLAGKLLLARSLFREGQWFSDAWFSLPELKRLEEVEPNPQSPDDSRRRSAPPALAHLGDAWLREGVVYDKDLKEVLLLQAPLGFVIASPEDDDPRTLTRWGAGPIEPRQPEHVARFTQGKAAVLEDQPAELSVSVRYEERKLSEDTTVSHALLELTLKDLVSRTEQARLPLAHVVVPRERRGRQDQPLLRTAGSMAYVLFQDRLFSYKLGGIGGGGGLDREKFPEPIRFRYLQTAKLIPLGGTVRLEHALLGGEPPYGIALPTKRAGMSIDPVSGILTVEGPAAAKAAEEALLERLLPKIRQYDNAAMVREKHASAAADLDAYIKQTREAFQRLVGQPPEGAPVLFPIDVRGVDRESQAAHLRYHLFVELPQRHVEGRILQRVAEQERQLAQREAKSTPAQVAPAAVKGGSEKELADLRKRLETFEERVEKLESKIEALIRTLSKKTEERH